MKPASHSAARTTSSLRSGSALTLGIASSSESSSNQGSLTARESTRDPEGSRLVRRLPSLSYLGDVFERDRVGQRAELLQALVLDLPDPLARDVEGLADLVQRPRMLAVEPVPQLEHAAFAGAERLEHAPQRRLAQLDLRDLLRQRLALVGEEVPELRLLLVADRLLQRDRRLRAAADLLDLVRGQLDVDPDLERGRLATELGAQLPLRADDLV